MNKFIGPLQLEWMHEMASNPHRHHKKTLSAFGFDYHNPNTWNLCCLGQALVCLHKENVYLDDRIESVSKESNSQSFTSLSPVDYQALGLFNENGVFAKNTSIKVPTDLSNPKKGTSEHRSLVWLNDTHPQGWEAVLWVMKRWPELVFKEPK